MESLKNNKIVLLMMALFMTLIFINILELMIIKSQNEVAGMTIDVIKIQEKRISQLEAVANWGNVN